MHYSSSLMSALIVITYTYTISAHTPVETIWTWYEKPIISRIVRSPKTIYSSLAKTVTFAKAFYNNPTEVGSLIPSSPYLADEITSYVCPTKKQSLLEAGPGTGAFTGRILEKMSPHSHVTAAELNKTLYEELQKLYPNNNHITMLNAAAQSVGSHNEFDTIISGIPFNNLPSDVVFDILQHYESSTKPEGIVSFFEYKWLPRLHALHPDTEHCENFARTQEIVQEFKDRHTTTTNTVWFNVTPAYVHHIQLNH